MNWRPHWCSFRDFFAATMILYVNVSHPPSYSTSTEFAKIARATGLGFLMMGFIGFFVKLIHIPINNILMGGV